VPIYEYLCAACAYRFERKQSIKDDPVATCERCGNAVTRLISSPAIMFKGSGWYVTDYSDKLKPPTSGEPPVPATDDKAAGDKKDSPVSPTPTSTQVPSPASSSNGPSSSPKTSSDTSTPTRTAAK
jgi:putative FmdB family regulatory protein